MKTDFESLVKSEDETEYKVEGKKEDFKVKQANIINHYGQTNQLNKLIEECGELIAAISRYNSQNGMKETLNLIEELADVKNLIEQLELIDNKFKEGVKRNIKYKVNRELERMKTKWRKL